jgi:hypothetical protein
MTHLGEFRGFNYTPPEPSVSLPQAIVAALCLALFVCGGLALLYGATC